MRPFLYSLLIAMVTTATAAADRFDEREKTYVAGLRSRQLYSVAEFYCIDSLQRSDLTITDQAALTVELIQNRAAKAQIASADKRSQAWQAVWKTQQDFESAFPGHSKSMLVTIQTALARLSYASSIQQELAAEMIPPEDTQTSRDAMIVQLRTARRTFEQIERDIQRKIPEQRVKSTTDDEFSAEQLTIMRSNVRFQLARCQLQTAYGYDADDTVNRTSIISDVLQRIAEVQSSVSPQQRIWWLSKVTQIECLRLIGRNVDAAQMLNRLPEEDRPADLASAILEQRLLLAADRGDVAWAKKHLQQSADNRLSDQSPQMDIAQMKVAIMLSVNANDAADRQRWLDRAAQIVANIDQWHGAYWNRRAGLAMIESLPPSATPSRFSRGDGNDVSIARPSAGQREIMIQNAKQAARRGNDDDAVRAWLRAIDLTTNPAQRQPMLINVSKSLERLNRHTEAANYLIDGAKEDPTTPIAAAMHLRGCWNLAQQPPASSSDQSPLVGALKEHLQQWPDPKTAAQAATWLVAEQNKRGQFEQAVQTLIRGDTNSTGAISANTIGQLRTTFVLAQRQIADDTDRIKTLGRQIVDYLQQQWVNIQDAQIADTLTATSTEIALSSSCLSPTEVAQSISRHTTRFPIDTRSEIQLYRSLLTATVEDNLPAAAKMLKELAPTEPQCRQILAIANQQQANNNRSDTVTDEFCLLVAEAALRTPLSIQQSTAWKFENAKRLNATGHAAGALAMLTPLAQQFRTDVSIQLEYARALSQSDDHADDAIDAWRKLAQQLAPKSEPWYEAKFNVAQGLADSQQPDAAKKILKYVQAVYGWQGSAWAEPIERLLRQL